MLNLLNETPKILKYMLKKRVCLKSTESRHSEPACRRQVQVDEKFTF